MVRVTMPYIVYLRPLKGEDGQDKEGRNPCREGEELWVLQIRMRSLEHSKTGWGGADGLTSGSYSCL